ncbi:hypothetical protein SADUNF_Sadunf08G0166600 [Salix dunnii]|uniref:K+ potassium transporter integral membrane domain-containing protein n=1 Tax=Salix dunnii TaxID=1413687 RepID=A0A835JUZ4_9ROSI|nr:hypothetical protein SADUNF_Sadunf08G0166600 [Salix dunnii]
MDGNKRFGKRWLFVGGTFAMHALISRYMNIRLMPSHQVGDTEQHKASEKRIFNFVKYDPRVLQAFNPYYIWVYFRKNPMNAWKSLAGIVLCLTVLSKILVGAYFPVTLAFTMLFIMIAWTYGRRKRLMHEHNNVGDLEILNNSRIARLPTNGIFYGDYQAIPLIFRHYASSLMAIPSILIFISHKALPFRYVPLEKQLSFRRIYLDQPVFHYDVNIRHVETRMEENCFKEIVINRLIEFLQQHSEGEEEDGHDADDAKKSTADMTAFVQNLLQQMQSRFQTMSDSIITKNILFLISFAKCIGRVVLLLFHMLLKCEYGFLDCNALDDMGTRIDELEQSIDDLRSEMGLEGSPSPSVPPKAKADPKSGNNSA